MAEGPSGWGGRERGTRDQIPLPDHWPEDRMGAIRGQLSSSNIAKDFEAIRNKIGFIIISSVFSEDDFKFASVKSGLGLGDIKIMISRLY